MMNGLYLVTVKFLGLAASKKEYDFFGYENYQPGDIVVVDTQHGFATAEVVYTNPLPFDTAIHEDMFIGTEYILRGVICKVDTTEYLSKKQQFEEKAKIKFKMDRIVDKLKEEDVYDIYAEKSPELKELLGKYRSLM